MKIVAMLLVLGILVSCSGNSETLKFDIDGDQEITILNLFDVTTEDEALNYGDGFSSVIQVDDVTVLFDTPYKDYVMDNGDSRMMQNIAILEYQVEAVDIVYISHRHSKPGLVPFLEMNSDVELYLTSDIDMTRTNERFALDYYHDEPFKEIGNHIYTSGPMLCEKDGKEVIEQFMLIETESGIIIVVGCSHPTINQIIQTAQGLFPNESIYMIYGGLHLKDISDEKVFEANMKLLEDVENLVVCHCTGNEFYEYLSAHRSNVYTIGAGGKISIQ